MKCTGLLRKLQPRQMILDIFAISRLIKLVVQCQTCPEFKCKDSVYVKMETGNSLSLYVMLGFLHNELFGKFEDG